MSYFLDSSALLEVFKGNKNYERFLDEECYTSLLSLHEVFFLILAKAGEDKAKEIYARARGMCLDVDDRIIFKAGRIKLEHTKLGISDCFGLALSRENDIRILSSNKNLKDFPYVLVI